MGKQGMMIKPESQYVGIRQAADFLCVSPSYLIGLLKQKEVKHIVVDAHRRIRMDDLLIYKEKMILNSKAAMNELIMLSQELGLD